MGKHPILHYINEIKNKLGFGRTMTADGADVVDAVNKQYDQKANQDGIAIIVDGDTASVAIPVNGYAYVKNNTHGLTEGIYQNTSTSAFPVSGGTADSTVFTTIPIGALNAFLVSETSFIPQLLNGADSWTISASAIESYKYGNIIIIGGTITFTLNNPTSNYFEFSMPLKAKNENAMLGFVVYSNKTMLNNAYVFSASGGKTGLRFQKDGSTLRGENIGTTSTRIDLRALYLL